MAIRIGIDVGEHSVGIAAVEYDDDGYPIHILSAVSHIHDGGQDPDTGKSPRSRLATAGVARRTRRLVRNRRRRLALLDDVLTKHGYGVPRAEVAQTHDVWLARARLVKERVADPQERDSLVVLASRHVARHRGWRNPWWSYARLTEAPSPTEHLTKTLAAAVERYGAKVAEARTLGQLVAALAAEGMPVRPTNASRLNPLGALLVEQVLQEDSLAELRRMLEVQGVPTATIDDICAAVFFQSKPTIPRDRIGRCDLQPDQVRAPIATLEFQEYRIRAAVGNLRVGREKRLLTEAEHDAIVTLLSDWRDENKPRWRDVAAHIDLAPRDLTDPSLDGQGGSTAPHNRTAGIVEATFRKTSTIGAWWRAASPAEQAELIETICDLSGEDQEVSSDRVASLLARDDVLADLDKLNHGLETGRASYSRETLSRLNECMRERRCDVHDARKEAFNVDDSWVPSRPSLDDPVEHPTVARVNALVRRFLGTAVAKWGMPDRIVVEHVRNSFAGPTALAEKKREIAGNTRVREQTADLLRKQGIEHPNRSSLKRSECVERQNCICLYCGVTITLLTCELDHIVPRAEGGGSRRENLVAVCRECNAAKGKLPFAVFAGRSTKAGVSVESAQGRVRDWQRSRMTNKVFARLQGDVRQRLAMTADDEDFGDRSIESTAYAARELRARIETFLDRQRESLGVPRGEVLVFSGIVTSEARKAGGVDDRIRLREFTRKSRFDRRHHAIDAAVLTTISLGVAKSLTERANLHRDNDFTGKDGGWKEYRGSSPGAQASFGQWRERIGLLAELIQTAVADDRVVVMRPLRLSPRVGSVHADTIQPFVCKGIGEPFTKDEVLRVADRGLFLRMSELASGEGLESDDQRGAELRWDPALPVKLFPSNAAYLAVRGGAVAIGSTVRYARIYAWRTREGFGYGMVRMYVGEFAKIGFLRPRIDIFTAPLPPHSQALRTANATLRARLESGEARLIGWIATDDELELDPAGLAVGDDAVSAFLRVLPESRWVVRGFMNPAKVTITPAYLASEGLEPTEAEADGRASAAAAVRAVVGASQGGVPLAVNRILGVPGCTVIRRTIMGAPRWRGEGLPLSWNVQEAAERAFTT